jgi:peptide/nickel transport system substrate-binding protein
MAPRDIRPGREYGASIIDAIGDSAAMVLLFTVASNRSPQVLREVERAVSKSVPIVPVRVEDILPSKSLEYFISTPHWLDAMSPPFARHLPDVTAAVRGLLPADRGRTLSNPLPPEAFAVAGTRVSRGVVAVQDSARGPARRRPVWVATFVTLLAFGLAAALYLIVNRDQQGTPSSKIAPTTRLNALSDGPAPGAGVSLTVKSEPPTTRPAEQESPQPAVLRANVAPYHDPFVRVTDAKARPDYALGDWMISNFPSPVSSLTPFIAGDLYSQLVRNRVQESLAYLDPVTREYVPLLAESWQVSPDGMTVTFQLRAGVTFSDGHPFSADDVVFTYEWATNPMVSAERDRVALEPIASVRKSGQCAVVFQFKRPYYQNFELSAGLSVLPKHFYGKFKPEEFNQSVGLLMGTGPYKLKDPESWRPGTKIELLRNERYWGEPGPFARLVYNEITQRPAELIAFRNGELDQIQVEGEQYVQLLQDASLVNRTQHFEYFSPAGGYMYVAWNQHRGGKPTSFADKRVRLAMTMLIDRQQIVDKVFLGYAEVASGPFGVGSPQNDTSIKPWPYDPNRARLLLAEAGLAGRDRDGVLPGLDGQPFRFKLTYLTGSALLERCTAQMKDSFAQAGIVMEPEPVEWSVLQRKLERRDFDAISLKWGGGSVESDIYQMFHSDQINDNGDNFISYANPELDAAIEEARRTVDPRQRMALWQRCHRILHDDEPYTFMLSNKTLVFIDKRFKNVTTSKLGLNYVQADAMPIPWYVPEAEQKYRE